jgi:hypothetical protein
MKLPVKNLCAAQNNDKSMTCGGAQISGGAEKSLVRRSLSHVAGN